MPQLRFYSKIRAEHLIATGRMVLAAFFLLAIYIDPSEPSRYADFTYGILVSYLGYALAVWGVIWRSDFAGNRLHVVTHSIDLLVFACLMFLTTGPNSPFFVYFIFILVCATFRWQWRGTLWTAVAAMSVTIALACYPSNLLHDHSFELNRFIIRVAYLAVVAILLGYLGAYEESMRNTLSMLSEWPEGDLCDEGGVTGCGMLRHAAAILKVPRVVLLWEEEEEPWLHILFWSAERCTYDREDPTAFQGIVAAPLAEASFFCRDVQKPELTVVRSTPEGLQRSATQPLNPEFNKRFAIRSVAASRVTGESVTGHLFALDKLQMTADDLVLGGIVAHEVAARLDRHLLLRQLREAAAAEERLKLARDLHDGLLQSLAGAALQLESAQRLVAADAVAAREYILQTQQLLSSEQRDLRTQINELRPKLPRLKDDFGLRQRLEQLAERIRRQWELSCSITAIAPFPHLQRSTAREIYFVVHEALINAVRHAEAATLKADLSFTDDSARITVSDDGHGFAFKGSYDQDELCDLKRGPVTLRERIDALNGKLVIHSTDHGARLEITLPLLEQGD